VVAGAGIRIAYHLARIVDSRRMAALHSTLVNHAEVC
jgi:hypothetical protein